MCFTSRALRMRWVLGNMGRCFRTMRSNGWVPMRRMQSKMRSNYSVTCRSTHHASCSWVVLRNWFPSCQLDVMRSNRRCVDYMSTSILCNVDPRNDVGTNVATRCHNTASEQLFYKVPFCKVMAKTTIGPTPRIRKSEIS
jgi:hypothetical protein